MLKISLSAQKFSSYSFILAQRNQNQLNYICGLITVFMNISKICQHEMFLQRQFHGCSICQTFPMSKFCTIYSIFSTRYVHTYISCIIIYIHTLRGKTCLNSYQIDCSNTLIFCIILAWLYY